jgi:hypothetical protein
MYIYLVEVMGNFGSKGLSFSDLVGVQEVERRWEINVEAVK